MALLEAIQTRKTGAMIEAALCSGAIIAGAEKAELDAIRSFAKSYGKLFQITDDILDVAGTKENMGKTLGKDAEENKLTAVTLLGLDGAREYAARVLNEAKRALEIFGSKAEKLLELSESTLHRTK